MHATKASIINAHNLDAIVQPLFSKLPIDWLAVLIEYEISMLEPLLRQLLGDISWQMLRGNMEVPDKHKQLPAGILPHDFRNEFRCCYVPRSEIRTRRGSELAQGQTRFTVRSEFGQSALPRTVDQAMSHQYLQREDGAWIDATGSVVDRSNRVLAPNNMVDQPYRTPLYDNLGSFFNPGGFSSLAATMASNSASTTGCISAEQRRTEGALENNDGFEQTSFRVNVDHRLRANLGLCANVFHSISQQDELSGSPFRPILSYEPDIDLGLKDANGNFLQLPDPTQLTENPIWRQGSRDNINKRNRTLASGDVRFSPVPWLRLTGNF